MLSYSSISTPRFRASPKALLLNTPQKVGLPEEVLRIVRALYWQCPCVVNMAVHRVNGPNSMWLALFSGPHDGRIARLFRQWGRAVVTLTGRTATRALPPADQGVHE